MTTTIKTLSDGRSLTTDGARLFLDGTAVGEAALIRLSAPKAGMVAYAKTSAGPIGFTRADADTLNAAMRPAVTEDPAHRAHRTEVARKFREWNQIHNEGGEGHNPHAAEYRKYFPTPMGIEPRHPSDY